MQGKIVNLDVIEFQMKFNIEKLKEKRMNSFSYNSLNLLNGTEKNIFLLSNLLLSFIIFKENKINLSFSLNEIKENIIFSHKNFLSEFYFSLDNFLEKALDMKNIFSTFSILSIKNLENSLEICFSNKSGVLFTINICLNNTKTYSVTENILGVFLETEKTFTFLEERPIMNNKRELKLTEEQKNIIFVISALIKTPDNIKTFIKINKKEEVKEMIFLFKEKVYVDFFERI